MRKIGVLSYLLVAISFAEEAKAPTVPADVQNDVLPMRRILDSARAKQSAGVDVRGATRDGNLIYKPTGNRARTYIMTDEGLKVVRKGQQLWAPLDNSNPQADADDGKDTTAFENIGAPLTPEHLATFRLCKASRIEQGISDLNTYWMSALSAIAYLKYPLAFDRLKQMKFEQIFFIEGPSDVEVIVAKIAPKKNAKGEIIKDSGLSVVAFRGTDDPEDWLTNLDATTSDISGHNGEAWLHEGFALALNEVYGEILKALDLPNNPSPLFITGHSLGGALGMQMAIRLVSRESADVAPLIPANDDRLRGIYVFAIPRVGNEWARNILDKYMNHTRNFSVHIHSNTDPVSKVPFDWMGYKRFGLQTVVPYSAKEDMHLGNRAYWSCYADADYTGPSAIDWDLWHSSVDAHLMESYVRHFVPWRAQLARMSCDDAAVAWGPRFQVENPTAFKPLRIPSQIGKSACDYTAFSWGGNIQL
jgi:triacylglycerol lipase